MRGMIVSLEGVHGGPTYLYPYGTCKASNTQRVPKSGIGCDNYCISLLVVGHKGHIVDFDNSIASRVHVCELLLAGIPDQRQCWDGRVCLRAARIVITGQKSCTPEVRLS